jgi:hypothetical protein
MTANAWTRISALPTPDLRTLFGQQPDRLKEMTLNVGPIRFDWSKTHLTPELLSAFLELAQERDFTARRDALFSGAIVNVTENRGQCGARPHFSPADARSDRRHRSRSARPDPPCHPCGDRRLRTRA